MTFKLPYTRSDIIPHKLFCEHCGDIGKLLALRKNVDHQPYAFRCSFCVLGKRPFRFPLWSPEHLKEFEVIPA